MLRLPHALAAFYGAQLQHVSSLTLQHLLGASANGISITYGTSELAAATTAARPRCCCCSRRSFGTGSLPPNAMDLIKELRKNSGAPIADVKSCLAASKWDMSAALEALRLKGLAAAVKKASRHASQGLVAVAQQGHNLVSVVEINSETDFVGRSAEFQQLVTAAARAALQLGPEVTAAADGQVHELNPKQLASAQLPSGTTIEEGCALLAGQVRENIALRRGYLISAGTTGVVSSYVHMPVTPGAGRIAAVVALRSNSHIQQPMQQQLAQLGSDLAMHTAGMNTQYISRQYIPADALEAVRCDLATASEAQLSGKPAAVMAKIVEGKLAKWCKDSCLLDQPYLLDDSLTVAQLLNQQTQQLSVPGGLLEVAALLRVQVGEGLQREESKADFAAEVAAMAGAGR